MGSRTKRARMARSTTSPRNTSVDRPTSTKPATPAIHQRPPRATQHKPGDKPPIVHDADVIFGSIDHMPAYETIPPEFKRGHNRYCEFISGWFFSGRTAADMACLKERDGIDRGAAIRAIKAILGSWAPKHEHKEAACAYLLFEWFTIEGGPQ